jgi:phosphocarrier protein HPr
MVEKDTVVKSKIGLHALPATMLVKLAKSFKSKIMIHYAEKKVDAKSMFSLLGAGIKGGANIIVTAEGDDEVAALAAVVDLIETVDD